MIMEQPQLNPVEEYLSTLPSRTERTAREVLDVMAQRIRWKGSKKKFNGVNAPWWKLTSADVIDIQEKLVAGDWLSEATGEPYPPAAINRFVATLRGVLRQCWRQELMPAETYLESASKLRTVSARASR